MSGMRGARQVVLVAAAVVCCLAGVGCTYLGDRADDFGDCVELNGGLGIGLYAQAAVTDYLCPAVGWKKEIKAGWDGATGPIGVWGETASGFVLAVNENRGLDFVTLATPEWMRHDLYVAGEDPPQGPGLLWPFNLLLGRRRAYPGYTDVPLGTAIADVTWIDADVMLGIVGARAGLNPVELVDFVLGWTTLDILGDDGQERMLVEAEAAAEIERAVSTVGEEAAAIGEAEAVEETESLEEAEGAEEAETDAD